jgi:hypothetical protein
VEESWKDESHMSSNLLDLRTAESEEASLITLNSQMILHLLSNSFPYGGGSKVEPKDKAAGRRGV